MRDIIDGNQRAPWATRMRIQEIATRIRSAMEAKNLDLFGLSEKLNWTPARLLAWIDGSLSNVNLDDEESSTLHDLVQIGEALEMRWKWRIGKV